MSKTTALYRPLTPITPTHSPHASITSSRSRTPGQLSLHDYRKQQRQEVPLPSEIQTAVPKCKTIKRKVASISLHGGPIALPTAPPTPMEFEFGFEDEKPIVLEDDVNEEDLIDQFLSGNGRNRKGKGRLSRGLIREGTRVASTSRSSRSTPRFGPYQSSSIASTSSITSLPIMASSSTRTLPQTMTSNIPRSESSPPPSPTTPLLGLPTEQSPLYNTSTQGSFPNHLFLDDAAPRLNSTAMKKTNFNPIKRLPHPQESLPKLQPAPRSISPASAPAATSTYSPFSLRNFAFPDPPIIRPGSNPVLSRSTDDLVELLPNTVSKNQADISFTDLLHLYGASFELLNRHDSLESLNIVPSLSEPSSPNLGALPVFAPKQRLPKMSGYTGDPFGSKVSLHQPGYDSDADIHHGFGHPIRESYYPADFDSRSIRTIGAPATPGMRKGIVEYSDLVDNAAESSYTPALNQIFDQYGRLSAESSRPLPHRSVGNAPLNPPPPPPVIPIPHLELPLAYTDSPDRATDYGATQYLLQDHTHSSTPGLELSRRAPPNISHLPGDIYLAPSSSKLRTSSMLSFPEGISDSQSISEWMTTANNSTNDVSNVESMGESFPFGRPDVPTLLTNHQRRIITFNQIPEVPSPHSTVRESHPSLQAISPTPGGIGDDFFSSSMSSIPSLNIRHDKESVSLPVASSEYSEQTSQERDTKTLGSTDISQSQHRRHHGTQGHYAQVTDDIAEDDERESRQHKDDGMVDPALLSPEPNDDIETMSVGSDRRLSRWDTLSSPDRAFQSNELRRSLTHPSAPKNHRISYFDPDSGRTSVGVAGQNKLLDFGIEMQPITSNRSSTAPASLPAPIQTTQNTTHLNLDADSEIPSSRVSPLIRFRDVFFPTKKTMSSHNTSIDNSIPLPNHIYSTPYNRPASSARSSLQPLVPRPAPVVDRNRRLAQAWKPLRMRPKDIQPQEHMQDRMSLRMSPPAANTEFDHKRHSSRFAAATYPCTQHSTPSLDIEAAQPLQFVSSTISQTPSPEYLALQRETVHVQKKWSRIYLFISIPLPFMCALYALGMFDVFMQIHAPGRPRTLDKHRRWAWNIAWVELVGILVGLTVWGVQRQGA